MLNQNPSYQYKQITATTQVNKRRAQLGSIFVSSVSGSPTITVYDSGAGSTSDPKVVDTFIPVAATNYPLNYELQNGLYIVIGGTVSATVAFN